MIAPTRRPVKTIGLTDRGRAYAILLELNRQWPELAAAQRIEAMALVERLAELYRPRVALLGKLTA